MAESPAQLCRLSSPPARGRSSPALSSRSSTPAVPGRRWHWPTRSGRRPKSPTSRRSSAHFARCRTRLSAIVGSASSGRRRRACSTSAQDARRLADLRYQGSATSYLEVLDSDTRLFAAELGLVQAQLNELAEFVRSTGHLAAAGNPERKRTASCLNGMWNC